MTEELILQHLVLNEDFSRKVLPFLKEDYFTSRTQRTLFSITNDFIQKYNNLPSEKALLIELDKTNLTDDEIKEANKEVSSYFDNYQQQDIDWIVDETEKFCQDKAIYNAITQSIKILDGSAKQEKGAIPEILSDALGVTFDSHVGHDFIEDAESRFEFYHKKERRIPFDLDYFNRITKNGLPSKTLNVVIAGCVHPDTKIKVRFKKSTSN